MDNKIMTVDNTAVQSLLDNIAEPMPQRDSMCECHHSDEVDVEQLQNTIDQYLNYILVNLIRTGEIERTDVDNLLLILYNKIKDETNFSLITNSLLTTILYNFEQMHDGDHPQEESHHRENRQQPQKISYNYEQLFMDQSESNVYENILSTALVPRNKKFLKLYKTI